MKSTKALPRKGYMRFLKRLMRIKYRRPRFIFLGQAPTNGAIIVSNHEGATAPMLMEIYYDAPLRWWGTHEMNSGLKMMYRYQSEVYYHQKHHWPLWCARLFCLIASPLTNLFYKGFDLISTYRDSRFRQTLRDSVEALERGENLIIYPEDSSEGYLAQMKGFHPGFVLLGQQCARQGLDIPVYAAYYRKSDNTYIFDAPVLFSSLSAQASIKQDMAALLCRRCNELGVMHL